ncbi:MAG: C2H2-type zinc finger protein [Dehalococcoidia bacterium]
MAERCPICDEEFSSVEALEHHDQSHHGTEGQEARPRAEERQREPGAAGGAPGGNPVVDSGTGQIESP